MDAPAVALISVKMLAQVATAVAAVGFAWLAHYVNNLISKRKKIAGLVSLELIPPQWLRINPPSAEHRAAASLGDFHFDETWTWRETITQGSKADGSVASTSYEQSVLWASGDRRRMSQGFPARHPFSGLGRLYSREVEAARDVLRRLVGHASLLLAVLGQLISADELVAGVHLDHYGCSWQTLSLRASSSRLSRAYQRVIWRQTSWTNCSERTIWSHLKGPATRP